MNNVMTTLSELADWYLILSTTSYGIILIGGIGTMWSWLSKRKNERIAAKRHKETNEHMMILEAEAESSREGHSMAVIDFMKKGQFDKDEIYSLISKLQALEHETEVKEAKYESTIKALETEVSVLTNDREERNVIAKVTTDMSMSINKELLYIQENVLALVEKQKNQDAVLNDMSHGLMDAFKSAHKKLEILLNTQCHDIED